MTVAMLMRNTLQCARRIHMTAAVSELQHVVCVQVVCTCNVCMYMYMCMCSTFESHPRQLQLVSSSSVYFECARIHVYVCTYYIVVTT